MSTPSGPANGERLDSWKEIAAYFDRNERTVQLWEKKEGLPVHRHQHTHSRTVYAYRSELDAWWQERRIRLEETVNGAGARRKLRRAGLVSLLSVGMGLLGYVVARVLKPPTDPPPLHDELDDILLRRSKEPSDYMLLGRPSPSGRFLPYADSKGDLAIFDLQTGEVDGLTSHGPDSYDSAGVSAVSADDRYVAYGWSHYEADFTEVRTIPREGGVSRVVYRDDEVSAIGFVEWASDSRHIVVRARRRDGAHQILLVDTDLTAPRVLATLEGGVPLGMSLSPDDRYLVYDAARDVESRHLYILDVTEENAEAVSLLEHPANDVRPFWSPDGSRIVFGSDRAGGLGVWTLAVRDGRAEGEPQVVRRDMGECIPWGMTRPGQYYYYTRAGMSDVFVATLDLPSGRVLEPPVRVAEYSVGSGHSGDWSPDGSRLAYVRRESYLGGVAGEHRLLIRSVENGIEREWTPPLKNMGQPRFAPDGQTIVLPGTDAAGVSGLHALDVASGATRPLASGDFADPHLGAEGRSVFYWSRGYVFERDLESGEDRQIFGPDVFNLAASPDGSTLAFTQRDRLLVMPSSGGAPRVLLVDDTVLVRGFSHDGQTVFVTRDVDGESTLWSLSVAGGELRPIDIAMRAIREIRPHPDGKRIAFTGGTPTLELWVMENFLSSS